MPRFCWAGAFLTFVIRKPLLGQAVGAVYLLTIILGGAARPLFEAAVVGRTAFRWPELVVLAVLVLGALAAGYLARRGLASLGRLSEYGAVVAIVLIVVVGLTVLPKVNWANYTPFLTHGWLPVLRGAGTLMQRFSLAYILLLFLPRTENAAGAVNWIFVTIFLVAVLMGVGILSIGIHGAPVVAATFLPSLQLIQDSVFGRAGWLTALAVVGWLLSLVLKAGLGYWLVSATLAETMDRDFRRLIVPVGIGVLIVANLLWSNVDESYIVFAQYFRWLAYTAGMAAPALLLLAATWQQPGEQNP
ncbi:MAG TPA: GerAB/ArcD/ProY family transporter [Spirochaetia bacterium]|nr:GerAB/ArcD/ProY family transporter [Spirochaetia bacterium]